MNADDFAAGTPGRGFRPAARLIDLANAVRADPGLSRSGFAEVLARHGEAADDLTEAAFSEADAEGLRRAVLRLAQLVAGEAADASADAPAGAGAPADAVGGVRGDATDRAASAINGLLAQCGARPRLSRHGGHAWHLHVDRDDDASWADWFTASSALALAQILSEHGRPAWGECAAAGCSKLYLATGPGGPRRFCSATCATRTRVAAHRRRRKGGNDDAPPRSVPGGA